MASMTLEQYWKNRKGLAPGQTQIAIPSRARAGDFMPTKWSPDSDPGYQRVASQIAAARAADEANRRSNIQQALIAFGMVPEGFSDKYGDIDGATRAAMDKNTKTGISMYARLLESKKEGKTAGLNRINAKGLFRSGAKGSMLKKGQLDFDRSLADSLAQLMGNVNQFSSGFASNELARQNALAQAAADAFGRYKPPTNPAVDFVRTGKGSQGKQTPKGSNVPFLGGPRNNNLAQ